MEYMSITQAAEKWGIDHSYYYEGYATFKAEELKNISKREVNRT